MSGCNLLAEFVADRKAAIAPLYALSLFGLIMIAGVGWDYSRLATMDSELQNAADQAALAAASQLTGDAGARANAQAAANQYLANAGSPWVNETKLSNDGEGRAIVGLNFEFFQTWDHATDTPGPVATTDADAHYVRVTVDGREAFYALTAIGGVISSGLSGADAVATLEGAACNVPPLMVCAPTGDPDFPAAGDIGMALDLREHPQGSDVFTPGNFDLLQLDYDNVPSNFQNRTLGLNSDLLGCTGAQITTRPGSRTPETDAINTRFGIYANPLSCQSNGDFCPGDMTRSDLVRTVTVNGNGSTATCANTPGGTLIAPADIPADLNVPRQGYPLDTCMSLGLAGCVSFGDGVWPVDTYLSTIHGTTSAAIPGLDANGNGQVSRYEVYSWERADPSRTVPVELGRVTTTRPNRTTLYCSAPRPLRGTPVTPSSSQKDRRIVTAAVVDCAGSNGRFDVNTIRWVDLFLLGPVSGATGVAEIKAELLGSARRADGRPGFQAFGRKKAVLVR